MKVVHKLVAVLKCTFSSGVEEFRLSANTDEGEIKAETHNAGRKSSFGVKS